MVLNRDLAVKQAKGNVDKIVDIQLKYNKDTLNNEQKREDAALKILEDSFNAKLKTIKDAQEETRKSMQVEIDQQNRIFLASERTPKDIEKREKAILEIRKRYAIKVLRVALDKTKALAAAEQDPVRKAKLLKSVAELETAIIQIAADQAVEIEGEKNKSLALLRKQQESIIKDSVSRLADALGVEASNIARLLDAFSESADKNGDKVISKFEEIASITSKVGAVIGVIGDISNRVTEQKIQEYDDEIQANNDFYTKKLDNENLSEEQRSQLEAERERKNAELEKKKRDEQRKQAEVNKATAIFEAIISTAAGVAQALPNIPLAVLTGVLGAAQIAAISAQPIPKYKHGRKGGEAEYAYVGDGGVNEIIARAGGGYEITPNRETLTYLNKGDSVLPDANKFLQEQAYNLSLSAQGRTIENIQVQNGLTKQDLDTHAERLVKALSENKTSVRIHNNNSIASDLNFINRLNDVL